MRVAGLQLAVAMHPRYQRILYADALHQCLVRVPKPCERDIWQTFKQQQGDPNIFLDQLGSQSLTSTLHTVLVMVLYLLVEHLHEDLDRHTSPIPIGEESIFELSEETLLLRSHPENRSLPFSQRGYRIVEHGVHKAGISVLRDDFTIEAVYGR